jgi:hypothetical protein
MRRSLLLAIALPLATGLAPAQTGAPVKTAEQVYKNIRVLRGQPEEQLQAAMAFITGSLGVRCNHCHAASFDSDDKPAKRTARRMIQMVFELNDGKFGGVAAVTCYTCHRGNPKPASVPPVGQNLWQASAAAVKPAALPSVDEILERHVEALGGAAALRGIKSRVVKGSRVGADGVLVPEELYQKAPKKLLVVTTYPSIVFRSGFNGTRGWAVDSQGNSGIGEERLAELEREAEFYADLKLRELYAGLTVSARTSLDGRDAYVLEGTTSRGTAERLYFDVETGLLRRRYRETKSVLGPFPTQTEYEDFRVVDGIKVAFTIRWSMPGRAWGRKLDEVKHNVAIEDATFEPPPR